MPVSRTPMEPSATPAGPKWTFILIADTQAALALGPKYLVESSA